MKKPKSRYHIGAIELGQARSFRDNSITLLGVDALLEHDSYMAHEAEKGRFTKSNSFSEVIGDGCRFYYRVEHFHGLKRDGWESGVGYFRIEGDEHILDREIPLYGGTGEEEIRLRSNTQPESFHYEEGWLRVSSVKPKSFMELLAAPHSVIASIGSFTASPVEIEENTLLGRKDDIIQSIDMGELKEMEGFSDIVTEIIVDSQKQIKMSARRLDLTRKNSVVSAPVLRATPVYSDTEKPPAQQGMIIYNKDTRKLEFFDGMDWNPLG